MAKQEVRTERDERELLESRAVHQRSAPQTPLSSMAVDIAVARAEARHRRLSLVDYGN